MKKFCLLWFAAALLLWGCGAEPVFEQLQDVYLPPDALPQTLQVALPEDASVLTMGTEETGDIYFCDGYTLTVQTLAGGDLNRTLQDMTGYTADALTVLERSAGGTARYECVWTGAGEGGDQVGRLVLLDDGAYHYVVTVMADAASAGDLRQVWDDVLGSVSLGNTGS